VADVEICAPTTDGLFTIDQNLNYIPDLNVDTPSVKNGDVKTVNGNLVVTFKLKPNQKWSDGSPLTANDLVFGTKLAIAIGNSTGYDQITNFKVIDARTLQCTYNGQFAPFVPYAPVPEPQAYLQKKYGSTDMNTIASKFVTDLYNSPSDVTNGPYKISSWATGNIVLVPNPYYNAMPADKSHPRLAQLKFVTISGDESGLAAALGSPNAGVDKAEDFQASDLPVLYGSKYHITVQPALFVEHLELNEAGPLKDPKLRQALQYAIDKTSLFHQLFPAIKDPNTFLLKTALPNTSPWADKSAKLSEYNPAKAKALLKAAGYATDYNGPGKHLFLRFATTTTAVRQKDFQILSRDWAAVGIQ
jgi:peptide/nickel transport system substrate-binding protein